jgi:hypothetical protein
LLKKLEYEKLDYLGLVVYQPRKPTTHIIPEHIRINALCLVLVYADQEPTAGNPQQQKILYGMVSVLELAANQIMYASIMGPEPDFNIIRAQIALWQPEYILQLSMETPVIVRQNCVRTFSPAYLLHNPQYKAQAYKTLLGLRATLHDTSKYNS